MIDVRKKLNLGVTDDMLWDTSVRVLNTYRMDNNSSNNEKPRKDYVATDKQRNLLRSMGIQFVDNVKLMASEVQRLIKEKRSQKESSPANTEQSVQPEHQDTGKDYTEKNEYF